MDLNLARNLLKDRTASGILGAAESSKRGRSYTLSATAFKKRRKTVKQLAIQFLRYIYDKCGVSRGEKPTTSVVGCRTSRPKHAWR